MTKLLIAHSNIAIAFFGAGIGAALGFFGSYLIWWLERRRQRQIARMQIAINLRHWMTKTANQMYDIQNFEESDGAGGATYSKLANFRFEKSLEIVALVEHEMATKLFKLIRKKDDANAEVSSLVDNVGGEEALDALRGRAAQIWLRALGIFDRISAQVAWSDHAFSDKDKAMMKKEVDRFQKLEQDSVKSAAELFR